MLRYLKQTRELPLRLGASPEGTVTAAVDASYASYPDCKSVTGCAISLGLGSVYAKSSKQKLMTKSSTEAELVAASESAGQLLWTSRFIKALDHTVSESHLLQDNQSTMTLLTNGRSTSARTKHIGVRFFFIHDHLERGEIKLVYCPSQALVADTLTKPLQGDHFINHRDNLLGLR